MRRVESCVGVQGLLVEGLQLSKQLRRLAHPCRKGGGEIHVRDAEAASCGTLRLPVHRSSGSDDDQWIVVYSG